MGWRIHLSICVALLALGCRPLSDNTPTTEQPAPIPRQPEEPKVKVVYPNVPGSFVATVKKIKPSVVNIFAAQLVRQRPRFGWPGLEEFFGVPQRDRVQRSLGSGFVIDNQGYVLTNYHVVERAHQILVQLEDRRDAPATVVGADQGIDLALLHIEQTGLAPATLGNSDNLEVGEWVMAVGNPFGLSHTVTAGIVSAKGRDYRDLGLERPGFQDFIQTDASINPGNSGGPLINVLGEVVGMNTAIAAAGQGLGFAVPINMIKAILPQLKRSGRVVPAWLGIGISELPAEVAHQLGITSGVLITEVFADSPAARGGLRERDIIVAFNGEEVSDASKLGWLTTTAGVGSEVEVKVLREQKLLQLTLRVTNRPQRLNR